MSEKKFENKAFDEKDHLGVERAAKITKWGLGAAAFGTTFYALVKKVPWQEILPKLAKGIKKIV